MTSFVRHVLFVALASALATSACAAPEDDVAADASDLEGALVDAPAMGGRVAFQRYHEHTPTYGSERPTRARLSLTLHVRDHVVRREAPGFDGMERAFALVPRRVDDQLRWERVDLGFVRHVQVPLAWYRRDAYDLFHASGTRELDVDLAALAVIEREGVTFGIETNAGAIAPTAPVTPQEESPLTPPL